jgi:ferric-dicitrate binding protein FerR (iron transport regulator)
MDFDDSQISLIVRHLKGEISADEKKELFAWVYNNTENERLFYTLKDIWETAKYKQVVVKSETDGEWEKFALIAIRKKTVKFTEHQNKLRKLYRVLKVAAFVVFAFGIGFLTQRVLPQKEIYASVKVPFGAKTEVELADGSKVWVNSGSSLKYPARMDGKEVSLYLHGEAYFDIVSNSKRKLNVKTSTINIQVLGTSFNVRSYDDEDEVETTLVKGLISISGQVGDKSIEPIVLKPHEQMRLIKGNMKLTVKNMDEKSVSPNMENEMKRVAVRPLVKPTLEIKERVDLVPITSWKENKLIFKNERFEKLAREMERWYDVRIKIEDSLLLSTVYTGTFEKETIEQAMKALSLSLPFTYRIEKNEIHVIKRCSKNINQNHK